MGDRGWCSIFMLLPYAVVATVDLFAQLAGGAASALAPALRSYRSRLDGCGVVLARCSSCSPCSGVWPGGAARPPLDLGERGRHRLAGARARRARRAGRGSAGRCARPRLLPRRAGEPRGRAGRPRRGALLALGGVALLVVATNPFALVFLLPSLHLWLWLPQVRDGEAVDARRRARRRLRRAGAAARLVRRAATGSASTRPGTRWSWPPSATSRCCRWRSRPAGSQAPRHLSRALALGRYAPYPARGERPPRGPGSANSDARRRAGRLKAQGRRAPR